MSLHDKVVCARLGGLTLVWFGVFAGLGAALAALVVAVRASQAGLSPEGLLWPLAVGVPALALVGSRLWALAVMEWGDFRAAPWATLFRPTFGWQGGFLLATAGVVAFAVARGQDPLVLADVFAFALPAGQAVGRIGCLTYGCCHGRPTTVPWAIRVWNPESKTVWHAGLRGVRIHPAQAYAALANGALAAALAALALAGPLPAGTVAGAYLVADGAKRVALETVRGVPVRRLRGRTPFQWFAIAQAGAGAAVLIASRSAAPVEFSASLWSCAAASLPCLPVALVAGLAVALLFGVHREWPVRRIGGAVGYQSKASTAHRASSPSASTPSPPR